MKAVIVPAQITTIEDRIAGNLNLTQLLLLMIPLFGGSLIYIIFPQSLHFATYKIVLTVVLVIIFGFMSIRIRDKILLQWAVLVLRYRLRPRYHVFDKNDYYLRNPLIQKINKSGRPSSVHIKQSFNAKQLKLITADIVKIQQIISDPHTKISFKSTKKGGMYVLITETK
jgi:hypothetical protein